MSEMIFELWEADELRDLPRIAGIMQHKRKCYQQGGAVLEAGMQETVQQSQGRCV